MAPDPDDQTLDLVAELLDLAQHERPDAINRLCGTDDELRSSVTKALADFERMPSGFLGGHDDNPVAFEHKLPDTIGPYRVVGLLGHGGMGVVYDAEQFRPARRVALKVIRPGYITDRQVKRFLYEADVLAQLQHPGIAQVFDADIAETPFGRQPYLAMERIDGPRIDTFVSLRRLDVTSRVALFVGVVDAVHAAHERGFVHRDLKPANVLVAPPDDINTSGRPKVLDFGVARAIGPGDSRSLRTEAGQLVGTLAYMSPEQLAGGSAEVDARSDIYSLGVMLYELLSGRLPHEVRDKPLHEAAISIRADEPTSLGVLDAQLRGDLNAVVLTALEKDPDRRYPTAAAFADDLRRFLRHEAVCARAPSRLYLARKFARRHRPAVIGLTATLLTLFLGVLFATHFALESAERESLAHRETYRASIAAADAAIRHFDMSQARDHLDRCPVHLRGWEWRYLVARLDDSAAAANVVRNPDVPSGPSSRLAFLDDGNTVLLAQAVAATERLHLTTWTTPTLEPLDDQTEPCGGSLLSLAPASGTSTIWENDTLRIFPAPSRADADGHSPAVAEAIRVVESTSEGPIHVATTSSDGRRLAVTVGTRDVYLVDLRSPDLSTPLLHPEGAADLAFSPRADRLYTAGRDRQLRAYDTSDGQLEWSVQSAHDDALRSVAVSADGAIIATGSEDRTIRLWDADTAEPRGRLLGHAYAVKAIAFGPDAALLASTDSATLRLWDLRSAQDPFVLRGHRSAVRAIAVSPDGATLASIGQDLRLWDLETFRPLPPPDELLPFDGTPVSLRFAINEDLDRCDLLVRSTSDLFGETVLCEFDPLETDHPVPSNLRVTHDSGLYAVRLTENETVLREWNTRVRCTAVSADGRLVAMGDDEITIYDAASGKSLYTLDGPPDRVQSLAFHPDGSRLASGSDDRVIHLWDIRSRTEVMQLRGHLDRVFDLAFSPDGETLYSASGDCTVRIWTTRPKRHARIGRHPTVRLEEFHDGVPAE